MTDDLKASDLDGASGDGASGDGAGGDGAGGDGAGGAGASGDGASGDGGDGAGGDGAGGAPARFETDGYLFKFVVQTRYIAAWDKENYPAILLSSNQAFELHGMGSPYKDNMGKVAMYINTVKGVGEHGRGGGEVTSAKKLAVGQWYTLTVEKKADQLCIQVDAEAPACATRTVPVEDFRMKTPGSISYPVGVNMESRNFQQLPVGAGGDGAGGDGSGGDGAGGAGASGDGAGGDGASGERRRRRRRRRRPAAGGDG